MTKHMEMMMDNEDEEDEYSAQAMAQMENPDDEFIVIDKVPARAAHKPGIGVTQMGSRFQTHFDSGGDFEFVTTQINIAAVIDDPSDEQPPDQSSVLIRLGSLQIIILKISFLVTKCDSLHLQFSCSAVPILRTLLALYHKKSILNGR